MTPVRELPPDYREACHLLLTAPRNLVLLNALSLIPALVAAAGMAGWWAVVLRVKGTAQGAGQDIPWWAGLIGVVLTVIVAHELLHGLAIGRVGHRVRYGFKPAKLVFYATTDQGLFRRNEFVAVALAPLVGLTLVGMALMVIAPNAIAYYVSLAVILNAGGALGDLWMLAVTLRYPPSALVRDEADGIRIYTPYAAPDGATPPIVEK
jgi:hypothetical protein